VASQCRNRRNLLPLETILLYMLTDTLLYDTMIPMTDVVHSHCRYCSLGGDDVSGIRDGMLTVYFSMREGLDVLCDILPVLTSEVMFSCEISGVFELS